MLVNGVWQEAWNPYQKTGEKGDFIRQTSSFRNWVTKDGKAGRTGKAGFKAEPGRYHLYVALICPWASRTLMVRKLKKLEDVISISIVEPALTDNGWRFASSEREQIPGSTIDHINGVNYMHELYTKADPTVSGRATVPVLWDKQLNTIVNNESADIIEMLNTAFDEWGDDTLDLRPKGILPTLVEYGHWVYENFNNAVYQAGFAQTQEAYDEAFEKVFTSLDAINERLTDGRPYLFGDQLTEADVRTFVTLIRFDAAYYGVFKCNLRRITDYPLIQAYMERVYNLDGVSETVNIDHIKLGYYSIKALNPNGIVPEGPALPFVK